MTPGGTAAFPAVLIHPKLTFFILLTTDRVMGGGGGDDWSFVKEEVDHHGCDTKGESLVLLEFCN